MSEQYVASKYNFAFALDDGHSVLAYNALSNALVVLDGPTHQRLDDIAQTSGPVALEAELAPLVRLGFLIPSALDELAAIRKRNQSLRNRADALELTLAPTLSCNFACRYCFQDHPRAYMREPVQDALLRFVERQTPELRYLMITWFGGEPILAIKVLRRLSDAFARLAEREGFQYVPSAMVTNGWGLTRENCAILRECNMGRLQITVDGVGSVHDQRRMLSDGAGTFDRIVGNIQHVVELLPHVQVTIRVNVERQNEDAFHAVSEYVRGLPGGEKIRVYPGQVVPYTRHSAVGATLDDQQFYELRRRHDLDRTAAGGAPEQFPAIRADTYCCAQRAHAYVVSPTGALFKCWSELGLDESRAVGHLMAVADSDTGPVRFPSVYDEFDLTQDPECAECKVLPICGGGCVWRGMMATNDYARPAKIHSAYKFGDNLERAVRLKYAATRQASSPVHP